jgi:hypothetical protein
MDLGAAINMKRSSVQRPSFRRSFFIVTVIAGVCLLAAGGAFADTVSYTGNLSSPEDTFETDATLSAAGTLTIQTWGFGGGTNAAGTVIPSGGFDPFVGVFDSSGDLIQGTSDGITNYPSFAGCPPAGLVTIGSVPGNCGDITMSLALGAGTYTVLLSDAEYIPNAIFDSPSYGNLSEGFTDLTGGVFQTCADLNDCNNDTANWALDVTTPGNVTAAPEPASLAVCGLAWMAIVATRKSEKEKKQ